MIRLHRSSSLRGGLYLAASVDTAEPPVRRLAPAAVLRIPLAHGAGEPGRPLVEPGERVRAGQLLSQGQPPANRAHSPVDGVIGPTVRIQTAEGVDALAIEVRVGEERAPAPQPDAAPAGGTSSVSPGAMLLPEEFMTRMADAGVEWSGADQAGEPPRFERILICGMETEPYLTVVARTLADHAEQVVEMAALLHRVFGARRTYLVVDTARPHLREQVTELSLRRPVRVVGIAGKYPHHAPNLLIRAITGVEVSPGKSAADIGICVIDACGVMDACRALRGQPHTWQTVTIAGDVVKRPGNCRVPVGMTVRAIVDQIGLRETPRVVLVGNPLNGTAPATPDVVVTKRTRLLSVWSRPLRAHPVPVSCIRCGHCIEVCPAGLAPRILLDFAERGRLDAARRLNPHACVDCGLCDYVCPSALPLMRGVQACRRYVPPR